MDKSSFMDFSKFDQVKALRTPLEGPGCHKREFFSEGIKKEHSALLFSSLNSFLYGL